METRTLSIWMCVLTLVLSQAACAFFMNKVAPNEIEPTVSVSTLLPPVMEQPAQAEIEPTEEINLPAPPPAVPDKPDTEVEEACSPPSQTVTASNLISAVTMAKGVEDETKAPVDETSVFGKSDTIYAVVTVENAPDDTRFKGSWYVVDVGDAAGCNEFIDEQEFVFGGNSYVYFSMTPKGTWPLGTYRVEIYVNDVLSSEQYFTVR